MTRILRLFILALAMTLLAIGCKGGNAMAGRYHIEQDQGSVFGEGAEKGELDLRDDKSFEISLGNLSLLKGTWTAVGNDVTLSSGNQNLPTTYRYKDSKLIPVIQGKEVDFWRFVKK